MVLRAAPGERPARSDPADERRAFRGRAIRGLHYHERGQDDLFACLQGTARVVVLDRSTGETFTEDIGDENPVAIYVPGILAHGFEALTDSLLLPRHARSTTPPIPTSKHSPGTIRASGSCGARRSPILSARDRRVLVTGAAGQLGHALLEAFPDARGLTRADWDVTLPAPPGSRPSWCCTRRRGRTSTGPRTTRNPRRP